MSHLLLYQRSPRSPWYRSPKRFQSREAAHRYGMTRVDQRGKRHWFSFSVIYVAPGGQVPGRVR